MVSCLGNKVTWKIKNVQVKEWHVTSELSCFVTVWRLSVRWIFLNVFTPLAFLGCPETHTQFITSLPIRVPKEVRITNVHIQSNILLIYNTYLLILLRHQLSQIVDIYVYIYISWIHTQVDEKLVNCKCIFLKSYTLEWKGKSAHYFQKNTVQTK